MQPPPKRKTRIVAPTHRVLLTKDTGVAVLLDIEDWKNAKDVIWYEKDNKIVNGAGTEIRTYLGIEFLQLVNPKMFDYRRRKIDG